jgi:hypothetical protein
MRTLYWLDADVFIQAKNGPYKRVPKFWSFLSHQLELGNLRSPKVVYDEVSRGDDELASWFVARKEKGLCMNASAAVQSCYGQIGDHVWGGKYRPHQSRDFLRGGDGWVIAHAMDCKGIVVTQESLRKLRGKIKVPTICKIFEVQCMNTYEMLDKLKAEL